MILSDLRNKQSISRYLLSLEFTPIFVMISILCYIRRNYYLLLTRPLKINTLQKIRTTQRAMERKNKALASWTKLTTPQLGRNQNLRT